MINRQLVKQLTFWGGSLIILLVFVWGYQTDWWRQKINLVSPNNQTTQTAAYIDQTLDDLGYWGYRIFLVNMINGENAGEAAYKWHNDEFTHLIAARLPDLPAGAGQFYQAWLERPDPRGFIKTGKLARQPDGRYIVLFISNRSYADFPAVIVSIETSEDAQQPSKIVVEGAFK